jgi:hypothetical protein
MRVGSIKDAVFGWEGLHLIPSPNSIGGNKAAY